MYRHLERKAESGAGTADSIGRGMTGSGRVYGGELVNEAVNNYASYSAEEWTAYSRHQQAQRERGGSWSAEE